MDTQSLILVIEPDESQAIQIEAALMKAQYRVDTCCHLENVAQRLAIKDYNLVILSAQLPKSSPWTTDALLEHIRSTNSHHRVSPVILLCDPEANDFDHLTKLVDHFWVCPFSVDQDYRFLALKCRAMLNTYESIPSIRIPENLHQAMQQIERLSKREYEILELIGEGLSNKEISKLLTLSEHSVRTHIYNIFSKLSIKRRSQAVLLDIYRKYGQNSHLNSHSEAARTEIASPR